MRSPRVAARRSAQRDGSLVAARVDQHDPTRRVVCANPFDDAFGSESEKPATRSWQHNRIATVLVGRIKQRAHHVAAAAFAATRNSGGAQRCCSILSNRHGKILHERCHFAAGEKAPDAPIVDAHCHIDDDRFNRTSAGRNTQGVADSPTRSFGRRDGNQQTDRRWGRGHP